MTNDIVNNKSPEEIELCNKQSELDNLEAELFQCELDLATLQAELKFFEARYLRVVGSQYAELDEILAQIAEAEAHLNPKDAIIQEQASQARTKANETAQSSWVTEEHIEAIFTPTDSLKKLYREVAKSIHPDLALDEEGRILRQKLMAEANRAYEEGDELRLRSILDEWQSCPESVKGDGVAVELVRIIRKIAQIKKRLVIIEKEIAQLEGTDLSKLKRETEQAEANGRDLLEDMALRVKEEIVLANKHLFEVTKRRVHL